MIGVNISSINGFDLNTIAFFLSYILKICYCKFTDCTFICGLRLRSLLSVEVKIAAISTIFGIISRLISKCLPFYDEFPLFFLLFIYCPRLIFLFYDITKSQSNNVNKEIMESDGCFEVFNLNVEYFKLRNGLFFDGCGANLPRIEYSSV